jgi:hypothetical protein
MGIVGDEGKVLEGANFFHGCLLLVASPEIKRKKLHDEVI